MKGIIMKLVSLATDLTQTETDAVAALTAAMMRCVRLGLVATVEQTPLQPLAMGNTEPTVTVRRAIDHNGEAAKRGGYTA
jgi:hypothetical protein